MVDIGLARPCIQDESMRERIGRFSGHSKNQCAPSFENGSRALYTQTYQAASADENVEGVSHQAVLRVLIAYCKRMRPMDAPDLDVPLHVLIKLTPNAYGCDELRHILGPGSKS